MTFNLAYFNGDNIKFPVYIGCAVMDSGILAASQQYGYSFRKVQSELVIPIYSPEASMVLKLNGSNGIPPPI